jgi:predicted secreted protein
MSTTDTTDTTPGEVAPAPYKPWHDRKVILTAALSVVLAAVMALTVLLGA